MTECAESISRRTVLRQLSCGAVGIIGGVGVVRGSGRKELSEEAAEEPHGREERKLGVALLGLGGYATGELGPALRKTQKCRLSAVITGTPSKAARWAQEYDLPEHALYSYETMDRIADDPGIDIVYIVTPPGLHREFCERAAEAGKHVISEKPMATTVEDCEKMIAACGRAGVQLSVGYRLHFDPSHVQLRRLGREQPWGKFEKSRGRHGFYLSGRSWRVSQSLGGGGPLMDLGIYIVQAACMAAGGDAPVFVTAEEPKKTRPELFDEVEETIRFTLEFPHGLIARGETSFTESYGDFRAQAPDGWIEFDSAFAYRGVRAQTHRGPLPSTDAFNQQAAQMDAFAEAIQAGEPSIVPGEMGLRDMRIITAIYEASRTGQRVEL